MTRQIARGKMYLLHLLLLAKAPLKDVFCWRGFPYCPSRIKE